MIRLPSHALNIPCAPSRRDAALVAQASDLAADLASAVGAPAASELVALAAYYLFHQNQHDIAAWPASMGGAAVGDASPLLDQGAPKGGGGGPWKRSRKHVPATKAMHRRRRCAAASRDTGVSSSSSAPSPQDPNMGFLPGCGDAHEEACPVVLDHAGADPTTRAPPSPVRERDRGSGEFDSAVVAMDSLVESGDDISGADFIKYSDELRARTPEIDTHNEMDEEEVNKLHLKYPLYRIKACLLLKGKPIDELDEAALERNVICEAGWDSPNLWALFVDAGLTFNLSGFDWEERRMQ